MKRGNEYTAKVGSKEAVGCQSGTDPHCEKMMDAEGWKRRRG
jgi:hypothetical protein